MFSFYFCQPVRQRTSPAWSVCQHSTHHNDRRRIGSDRIEFLRHQRSAPAIIIGTAVRSGGTEKNIWKLKKKHKYSNYEKNLNENVDLTIEFLFLNFHFYCDCKKKNKIRKKAARSVPPQQLHFSLFNSRSFYPSEPCLPCGASLDREREQKKGGKYLV